MILLMKNVLKNEIRGLTRKFKKKKNVHVLESSLKTKKTPNEKKLS